MFDVEFVFRSTAFPGCAILFFLTRQQKKAKAHRQECLCHSAFREWSALQATGDWGCVKDGRRVCGGARVSAKSCCDSLQLIAEPGFRVLWFFAALVGNDALGGRGAGGFAGAAAGFSGGGEFWFCAGGFAGGWFFARHDRARCGVGCSDRCRAATGQPGTIGQTVVTLRAKITDHKSRRFFGDRPERPGLAGCGRWG